MPGKILFLIALSIVSSAGTSWSQTTLKYNLEGMWGKTDDMAGSMFKLPFLLEAEAKRPLFLLVWELNGNGPIEPYCDQFEIKMKWEDKPKLVAYEGRPLEWHYEPKLITDMDFRLNIYFDPMYAWLSKKPPADSFYCRLVIPVWGVSSKSQTFEVVTRIYSQWFQCTMKDGKVIHFYKAPEDNPLHWEPKIRDNHSGALFAEPFFGKY